MTPDTDDAATPRGAVGVIAGSAFKTPRVGSLDLWEVRVETVRGTEILHRPAAGGGWVFFRHGVPHQRLPNQVDYRRATLALAAVGCRAVVVQSAVGVLDAHVPLFEPLLAGDLLMPDNRLPDGSACTHWDTPTAGQGHLVIEEGIFSRGLNAQLDALAGQALPRVTFAYVAGPRTKTPAENAMWLRLGAQVNSMSVGPEVVLLNELGIATAAVLVGHKASREQGTEGRAAIETSLARVQDKVATLLERFLTRGVSVPFANRLHRMDQV